MFEHSISPILFNLGPFQIRWYGLIYALGWLIGYYFVLYFAQRRKLMTEKQVQDYFIILLLSVVAGARLGSVLSELPYYLAHPAEIFAVWQGGLAFHGGFVLGLVATWLYCKKNKISMLALTDLALVPSALALGLGRIANFINGEFYGTPTTLPWGVLFPGIPLARHPAQLYEAIHMLLLFALLLYLMRKELPEGILSGTFILVYGVGRFWLETFKDPSGVTHILGMTWGQFWCIPMIIGGIYLLFKSSKGVHRAQKNHKQQS